MARLLGLAARASWSGRWDGRAAAPKWARWNSYRYHPDQLARDDGVVDRLPLRVAVGPAGIVIDAPPLREHHRDLDHRSGGPQFPILLRSCYGFRLNNPVFDRKRLNSIEKP